MASKKLLQQSVTQSTAPTSQALLEKSGSSPTDRVSEVISRVQVLLQEGKAQEAFDRINSHPSSPDLRLRNARGVCQLRMQNTEKAVRTFREFVLSPGSVSMREDVPLIAKTNFATALLMSGKISGGLSVLDEVQDQNSPSVQRLRSAIQSWKGNLSFWQKINWWMGADPEVPFVPDFAPGELF